MKIFGLMCVRNEADILEINIRYHLSLGVDGILAVDNGSDDDTARVLGGLARSMPIHWCRGAGEFRQAEILSRLAYEAFLRGADWLLPIDADEFWYAPNQPLREVLRGTTAGALIASVVNYVQQREQTSPSPSALLTMTRRPPEPRGPIADIEALVASRQIGFVEIEYPPKCIARASAATVIGQGNHWIDFAPGAQTASRDVVCLHAPIRSRVQLDRKADCARRPSDLAHQKKLAWHLRWWEQLGAEGRLDEEWAANSYDDRGMLDVGGTKRPTVDDPTLRTLVARFVEGATPPRLFPADSPETLERAASIPYDLVDRVVSRVAATKGWLAEPLAELLMGMTTVALLECPGDAIVEIGSYCGQSTVAIGSAAKAVAADAKVYAIDPHEGFVGARDTPEGVYHTFPTLEAFRTTVRDSGLDDVVHPIVAHSYDVHWSEPISLLFVDGWHDYENVSRDYSAFAPFVRPGGYVIFDDYDPYYPGVMRFVDELGRSGELEDIATVRRFKVMRKPRDADAVSTGMAGPENDITVERLSQHEKAVQLLRQLLVRGAERHQVELADRNARIESLQAELFEKVGDRDRSIRALQAEMHDKIAEANRIINELQAALARATT